MAFIKKYQSIIIIGIVLLLIAAVALIAVPDPGMTNTSNAFIKALITKKNPEKYCTGEVLYRVKTSKISPAKIISVQSTVIDSSKNYGKVYVVAEMEMDSVVDVGFYEAELIKDNGWKVFALRETMPRVNSFSLPFSAPDVGSFYKNSFSQISQGDASSLAGPARTAYQQQKGLKSEITDLKTKILYNNKVIIAVHSYIYDGRQVKVLVYYYKTTEGLKIVSIQNL